MVGWRVFAEDVEANKSDLLYASLVIGSRSTSQARLTSSSFSSRSEPAAPVEEDLSGWY